MTQSDQVDFTFTINGKTIEQKIEFKPYQSVMVKISPKGKVDYPDITFVPKTPVVRPKEAQKMNF
jgi:hypothetical protein